MVSEAEVGSLSVVLSFGSQLPFRLNEHELNAVNSPQNAT